MGVFAAIRRGSTMRVKQVQDTLKSQGLYLDDDEQEHSSSDDYEDSDDDCYEDLNDNKRRTKTFVYR